MTLDPRAERYAKRIIDVLDSRGFRRPMPNGGYQTVCLRPTYRTPAGLVVIPVDVMRCPVPLERLAAPDVLHQISAALGGLRVAASNTSGFRYVVCEDPAALEGMAAPKRPELPKRAELPTAPAGMRYPWPVGQAPSGRQLWQSLDGMAHVMVTGKSGSGKSHYLTLALLTLCERNTPAELALAICDGKGGMEFASWAGLPHLLAPVATDPKEIDALIGKVTGEMERRQRLMASVGAKNLPAYNARTSDGLKLPRLVLVVDELLDLVNAHWGSVKAEPFRALVSIAVRGRACGITLVASGQSAKAEVTGFLRENMGLSVCFRVVNRYASEAALFGHAGAAEIPEGLPGRALVAGLDPAGARPALVQAWYLPEPELDGRLADLRGGSAPAGPVFSDPERRLVLLALDMGGRFNIGELYEAQKDLPDHLSKYAIERLGKAWERAGWLTAPEQTAAGKVGRTVTAELLELVKIG